MATFAVVVLHVSSQNWGTVDVFSFTWGIFNLCDSIVRWAVPVFVMISGALFLGREQPMKQLYGKYIFRIITAFLFWSVAYEFGNILRGGEFKPIFKSVLRGHYHMWFLFMIVGLYMITPFLHKIVESDFLLKYFLILSLVFAVVLPQAIDFLSLISNGGGAFARELLDKPRLYFPLGFTGYFLLGYWLNQIRVEKRMEQAIYLLGAAGFLFTIVATALLAQKLQKPSEMFYGGMTVNILLESTAVFIWFKQHPPKRDLKLETALKKFSQYCFGTYLVHAMIQELLLKHGLTTLSFHPLISVPFFSLLIFAISLVISAALNHIPIARKYIV